MQLMTTPHGSPAGATLFTLGLAVGTFSEGIFDVFRDRFLTSACFDPSSLNLQLVFVEFGASVSFELCPHSLSLLRT